MLIYSVTYSEVTNIKKKTKTKQHEQMTCRTILLVPSSSHLAHTLHLQLNAFPCSMSLEIDIDDQHSNMDYQFHTNMKEKYRDCEF
jgi:hypothetical protein